MKEQEESIIDRSKPFWKWIGYIIFAISTLTTLAAATITVLGNPSIYIWVALVVSLGITFAFLIYIRIAKTTVDSPIIGSTARKDYKFGKKIRYGSLCGITGLSVLIAGAGIGYYIYKISPPSKVIILVADFEETGDSSQKQYKVTQEIVDKLRERTKSFGVEVRTLNEHISFRDGKDKATSKGIEHKAAIVIWGDIGKTGQKVRLNVNLEILRKPKKLSLLKEKLISFAPVNEIETYNLQINLGEQLSFLTLVVDGLAQIEAENYDGAIERFTNALNLPNLSSDVINLADVYYFRASAFTSKSLFIAGDDISKAILDLDNAISTKPEFGEAYVLRGYCYLQKGQRNAALENFNRAIQIKPNFIPAHIYQGLAYSVRYQYDLSEASFKNASSITPQESADFLARGTAFLAQRNNDLALQDFENVLNNASEFRNEALLLKCVAKIGQNNFDEASDITNQLLTNKHYFIPAKVFRALIYGLKDDINSALAEMNEAIKANPNIDKLYGIRGQIYFDTEQFDLALTDFEKTISLNPNSSYAYLLSGLVKYQKGDLNNSLVDLNRAIEIEPEAAEYYLQRGNVYKTLKNNSSAIKDYERAIEIYPQFKDPYQGLSQIYANESKFGNTEITIAQVVSVFPKNPVAKDYLQAFSYLARGEIYESLGNFDKAISDYTECIRLLPQFADGYQKRASAYQKKIDLYNAEAEKKRKEVETIKSGRLNKEQEITKIKDSIKAKTEEAKIEGDKGKLLEDEAKSKLEKEKIVDTKKDLQLIKEDTLKEILNLANEAKKHYEKSISLQNDIKGLYKENNKLYKEVIDMLMNEGKISDEIINYSGKIKEMYEISIPDLRESAAILQKENVDSDELNIFIQKPSSIPLEKSQ
ncbi:MAG TPA: tetratricopeptide repeat protein [Pyrinomonadaceae bacterium]|jgi:tetratricopeptide (TPR) repeat protein